MKSHLTGKRLTETSFMNKYIKRYCAASWWITWEDLSYPDSGIQKKIEQKAEKFNNAGIDLAIIFGAHFRWDFIYIWDRVHDLLKLIADELHKYDIQLFDHHSANLTSRPETINAKWDNFYRNKHCIPFYPSKNIINDLSFNGTKLNDFRMIDVVTGKPCYLPQYTSEIFCMNNPLFKEAYCKYIKMLFKDTGIDGLMCDDIIYYPGWHGCGCKYCREKFHKLYNIELPVTTDTSFWGNYNSPEFKHWVEMRYNDSADFLAMTRDTIGIKTPLLSCCSDSWPKQIDQFGLSLCAMQHSINHGMLEMCSEIVSEEGSYTERIPNLLLHIGILNKNISPSLGLGYGFCKDTAFLIWALNSMLGSSSWISTLKGRLGLSSEECAALPDEEDIVAEGYLFKKKHPQLFSGCNSADIAMFFSFNSLKFSGDSTADYSDTFKTVIDLLFKKNIQFDVIEDANLFMNYKFMVLSDISCLSDKETILLQTFIKNGGTVIATGPLGIYDEFGTARQQPLLHKYNIDAVRNKNKRDLLPLDKFFTIAEWPPKRKTLLFNSIKYNGKSIDPDKWIDIKSEKGMIHWMGICCQNRDTAGKLYNKIKTILTPPDFTLHISGNWISRIHKTENGYLIHILSDEIKPVEDPVLSNKMTNRKLIQSLQYGTKINSVTLATSIPVTRAYLYSPDTEKKVEGIINRHDIIFSTDNLSRYFIIELNCSD